MKTKHKHQYDTPVIVYSTINITGNPKDNHPCAFPCVKCSICGHIKRIEGLTFWGFEFRKIEELPDCELIEGINNVPGSFCSIDKCKNVYKYFVEYNKEKILNG